MLRDSISRLLDAIHAKDLTQDCEIVLVENGSTDSTLQISRDLGNEHPIISVASLPRANYGSALREGIRLAKGEAITIFNADFWDVDFLVSALAILPQFDFVLATKNAPEAQDNRTLNRRLITRGFNLFLNIVFDYHGTDTHGLKVLRADVVKKLIADTVTDGELMDTELVLRAQFQGCRIREIPITLFEKRPPRISPLKRVPKTIRETKILYQSIGFRGSKLARRQSLAEVERRRISTIQ